LGDKATYYRSRIQSLVGLPTLPTIAIEIQKIMREDRLSVVQTVPVIEQDPALAMKILKVANSAYYGIVDKINSLRQAVVIIGMRELAGIVLGFSLMKSMAHSKQDSSVNWKSFWEHSVAVGHISELLNEELAVGINESLYSMGLLHDIGKLVLFKLDPAKYEECYKISLQERITLQEAELRLFEITHQQAGTWIAKRWGLSKSIQEVTAHHHNLSHIEQNNMQITCGLVQLANCVASRIRMNFGYRSLASNGEQPEAWDVIQIRSLKAQATSYLDFVHDLDEHWASIREMVKLLNI